MSDENVPKLRLKPKLAADPIAIPPPPSSVVPAPAFLPPPPSGNNDSKAFRLKPKLPPAAQPEDARFPPPEPVEKAAELPAEIGVFPPPPPGNALKEPAPEPEKPASKFSLRPKATAGDAPAIAPDFPPLPTEIPAPASQDLIPPPAFIDPEQQIGEAPVVVLPRSLTARPFPPPPGNFPPPPAGGKRPPPWAQAKTSAQGGKKNFAKIGGAVVFVVIVLGGAFFAFKKFTAPPPPAKVVITPKVQEPAIPAQAKPQPVVAPTEETPPVAAHAPEPAPKPVEVVEAPPPSAAFKAWVDNLRVGGVRAGTETRVFIGGTAYAPGEVVNPQLGIVFDSYEAETRHLVFKDKTGAIVRRRN